MNAGDSEGTREAMASRVRGFYERHPYPPPEDDLEAYRRAWDDKRRRAETALLWPAQPFRDDRTVLVAGCGTVQAAHYAVRWPHARVVGVDVSERSIDFEHRLKRAHGLENLELRQLPVERASELGETFDHVVCTGVLHHLPDPDAGLRALRSILAPNGALNLMIYAPYGRAGIYMLQEYCRELGVAATEEGVRDLATSLRALPDDHPIVPLLRNSPDFATVAGLADALLHPNDRAYSVPQFLEFLKRGGFTLGRWVRQAPYLPDCGAIASAPHAKALKALPPERQYAAMELFRGAMVRHSAIAYRDDAPPESELDFQGDGWRNWVPIRLPGAVTVREKLPPGASAVLINRNHTFTDLYLPITAVEERLLSAVDGVHTIEQIARRVGNDDGARSFFNRLWLWDQIVFGR